MTFRVIDKKTGKEADTYEIALHEEWAKELCYCDMDGFAILEDGTLLLVDECGKFEYCDADRFEVVFDDERPHGEWKKKYNADDPTTVCSVCEFDTEDKVYFNFCPNCGADMRAKEGEAE